MGKERQKHVDLPKKRTKQSDIKLVVYRHRKHVDLPKKELSKVT
jgi:hypothetical protein